MVLFYPPQKFKSSVKVNTNYPPQSFLLGKGGDVGAPDMEYEDGEDMEYESSGSIIMEYEG